MEILLNLLEQTGPVLAGIITVPILQGLKSVSSWLDARNPLVKQLLAVVIAFGLTQLGALLGTTLPGELELFTGDDIQGAVAAGIAFAVHAGRKASENEQLRGAP